MKNPYTQVSNQYKKIELESQVNSASPHELIELLLQGARMRIATAQGTIQRKQIKEKGEHIGKAISIVEGLKMSLNQEVGGELAVNLKTLYDYIQQILIKANLNNDEALLTEANTLLTQVHEAWQSINTKATV